MKTKPSRVMRLQFIIATLTRNYLRRVESGRPTAVLMSRSKPITDAFRSALSAERY